MEIELEQFKKGLLRLTIFGDGYLLNKKEFLILREQINDVIIFDLKKIQKTVKKL